MKKYPLFGKKKCLFTSVFTLFILLRISSYIQIFDNSHVKNTSSHNYEDMKKILFWTSFFGDDTFELK